MSKKTCPDGSCPPIQEPWSCLHVDDVMCGLLYMVASSLEARNKSKLWWLANLLECLTWQCPPVNTKTRSMMGCPKNHWVKKIHHTVATV